jgi:SLOG cluster2
MLPHDALKYHWVALSASESPDLDRLGLLEVHARSALAEIARAVIDVEGRLAYGGHLRTEGYTTFLVQELDKWYRGEDLIRLYIAWPVHRDMHAREIRAAERDLPIAARLIYLDLEGNEIDDPLAGRGEDTLPVPDDERVRGFTAMRRYMSERCSARVLLGGRRAGFSGRLPGLVEEALLALEDGRPLFLAGGFGGVTLDILRALEQDTDWLPPLPDENPDPRWEEGMHLLRTIAAPPDWRLPENGLDDDENRRLAATHRPGEIAALVGLGVGRLAERDRR